MNNHEFLWTFSIAVFYAIIWTFLAGVVFLSAVYVFLTIINLIQGDYTSTKEQK